MALAAFFLLGILCFVSEKIPFSNGLGYDGVQYAWLVKNFDRILSGWATLSIESYNRFLPSLICRITFSVLGVPLEDRNIVIFFEIYNTVLLTLSAWLWGKIGTRAAFSKTGLWLGFVAIFCNHAILKYNVYYATLTDVTAMTLGLIMLWAYLRGSDFIVLGAVAAGAMTWPTLLPQGLLLWLFPSRPAESRPAPYPAFVVTICLLGVLVWHFFSRGERPLDESIWPLAGGAIEAVYLGGAIFCLLNARIFFSVSELLKCVSLPRLALAGGLVAAAPVLLWKLTGFRVDYFGHGMTYLYESVRLGMKFPGESLVAHPLYYGPWVLLLFMFFPKAARQASKAGLGVVLVCIMTALQSLTPLSRQLIAAMPFFVFLLIASLEGDPRINRRFLLWFTVLSLAFSKVWMRFSLDSADPEKTFCFDWYVSSTGCWMPFSLYLWQGLLIFLTFIGLWFFLRHRSEERL